MTKLKFIICFLFLANTIFSQVNTTITGTIYSEGIKLAQAKVAVLGTNNYVFTDSIGQYKINVLEGNVLEFSYKGKTSTTFTVRAMNVINVTLKDENTPIEEEMIILSTSIPRKKKPEKSDYETGWEINPTNAINTNNDALFVVNGTILNKAVLEKIPNENIESLNVLKDKAAILKYNELGKNGVIEIKTKGISKRKLKKLNELYPFNTEVNLKKLNNYSNIKHTEISDSINPIAMQKLLDKALSQVNQKTKTIYGIVSDCENFPLSKVLIKNFNTKKSTTSDSLGNYTIEANKKDIILFAKPNYQTQQFEFLNKKEINIKLKEIPRNEIRLEKPVIYLYPKEKTDIELSINFEGKILTTFPKLEKSWKVTAYENGQIFDKKTNRFYTSLFWDGEISFPASHYQYKTGFVVEKEKLTSFLIEKLEYMGLNTAETNDFIQYWLPILEQNDYTFIHFLVNEEYNVFSTNDVNPKPDTSIRIFMEFYGTDERVTIQPQKLPSTKRNGFTLVEWGGSDVSNMKPIDNLKIN